MISEEIDNPGYGIPYAMYTHDVERLEEVNNWATVNEHLQNGWVLLWIGQQAFPDSYRVGGAPFQYADPVYIMGVPYPIFCGWTYRHDSHTRIQKEWNHQRKVWECRWCIERSAEIENSRP